jgi:hypothetical protein
VRGDMLASAEFGSKVSVLVIQQHIRTSIGMDFCCNYPATCGRKFYAVWLHSYLRAVRRLMFAAWPIPIHRTPCCVGFLPQRSIPFGSHNSWKSQLGLQLTLNSHVQGCGWQGSAHTISFFLPIEAVCISYNSSSVAPSPLWFVAIRTVPPRPR